MRRMLAWLTFHDRDRNALLYAMRKGRVLLHVPSTRPNQPYVHTMTDPPTGRWCDRPPYTYDCMWEPLSYCDPPDPSLPVSTSPNDRRLPSAPDDKVDIAKITTMWLWKSSGMWQRGNYYSLSGAYRYLFRPRKWIRDIAGCLMEGDGLRPRQYVGLFLRLSKDKAAELRDNLPPVKVYAKAAKVMLKALGMRHVFVSTASPSGLEEFKRRLNEGEHERYVVSHTDNPRSDNGDMEIRTNGRNANWTMSMGTVAAVNLLMNSQAAVVVSLAASTWTSLQRELHSEPPWNTTLLAKCHGSQQYITADLYQIHDLDERMLVLDRVLQALKTQMKGVCNWWHHHFRTHYRSRNMTKVRRNVVAKRTLV